MHVGLCLPRRPALTYSRLANFGGRVNAHGVDTEMHLDMSLPRGGEIDPKTCPHKLNRFQLVEKIFFFFLTQKLKREWMKEVGSSPSFVNPWGNFTEMREKRGKSEERLQGSLSAERLHNNILVPELEASKD